MSVQSPDSTSTGAIEDKALSKEDLIEFLGEDETKEPETLELEEAGKKDKEDKKAGKETEDDKEGKEGEDKELSLEEELEKELEEPDVEELDIVAPPSRREILTKFPELFKTFPSIEKAIYREQRYAEILPTIQDAQVAVNKANLLDTYEKEILDGSFESLLSTVRDNDKKAYAKVVDNYLPNLFKVDQPAYWHTVGNVLKHTIISMVKSGKDSDDEDLSNAAAILNKFIFGTNEFTHPRRLSEDEPVDDKTKSKENEISQREKEFNEKKFSNARDTLGTKVDNMIKSAVDRAIDPNNSMTDYVKRKATLDVLEGLDEQLQKDTRFKTIFDKLWERAFDKDFDSKSMDNIQKAYLSKAKTLLPLLISKARSDALKGLRRMMSDDKDKDKDKRGHLPVGKTRSSTTRLSGNANQGNNSKTQIPKGMSTLDFLNSED